MSKPYVYVVDDDDVVRLNIVKKLSRLQCHVRAFESGEALMAHLVEHSEEPDLLVLDYKMGGMNGLETLRAVRAYSQVPAVIFTAYHGWINMSELQHIGNCEVMLKTVDLSTLDYIVNGAIAVKKARNTSDWVDDRDSPSA